MRCVRVYGTHEADNPTASDMFARLMAPNFSFAPADEMWKASIMQQNTFAPTCYT